MQPAKQCRITAALPAALLLVLSALVSFAVEAAALGDELILSRLGDPVEVEIAVAQWADIDLDQLQISAGTPEVYESFGLDYQPALENLNFNLIGPSLDGEVKVLVSSREPMHEPYLELLLVLRWPGGSLLREYVLLFDPPQQVSQTAPSVSPPAIPQPTIRPPAPAAIPPPEIAELPKPAIDAATASRSQQNQNPATAIQPLNPQAAQSVADKQLLAPPQETVTVREIDEPVPASAVDGAVALVEVQEDESIAETAPAFIEEGSTYTVEAGDNLWDIASKFGPPNSDLYQILLGIYELNRGSFVNGNISLLKYGVTLRLPTSEDIAGIDPANAKTLFDQLWNEGSERIGMAERGEPLPPLRSILAPEVARSEIDPTASIPGNTDAFSIPANTAALPAEANNGAPGAASTGALAPAIAASPVQGEALGQGLSGSPGQTTVPVVPLAPAVDNAGMPIPQAVTENATAASSANPYLDGINASAQFMQEMLRAKQQQVELLEAQMAAMNTRMLEISRVTERLNTSLDEVLSKRDRRLSSDRRNTFLLGGLVLVLSTIVVAIIVMALRLAAQIRVQHELLQTAIQSRPAVAAKAGAPAVKPESLQPLSSNDQTVKVQKHMAPEHALSVSIIEEEAEVSNANSPDNVDAKPELHLSKAELDAQPGARELEQPEKPEST